MQLKCGAVRSLYYGRHKNKERENVFTMSDTYYDTKVVIATTKANKITKYEELSGKTVGARTELPLNVSSKVSKINTVSTFDTGDLMNNSLSAGAVNAIKTNLLLSMRLTKDKISASHGWRG